MTTTIKSIHDIWMEGYLASGMDGIPAHASFEGCYPGETFAEACQAWANAKSERAQYFDADRLSYWGCRLFPTEEKARKQFG